MTACRHDRVFRCNFSNEQHSAIRITQHILVNTCKITIIRNMFTWNVPTAVKYSWDTCNANRYTSRRDFLDLFSSLGTMTREIALLNFEREKYHSFWFSEPIFHLPRVKILHEPSLTWGIRLWKSYGRIIIHFVDDVDPCRIRACREPPAERE
jgi:hypothetical protein